MTKDKRVKVQKIVIKVGEKEIPLSVEEAKELKEILGEMFNGREVIYVGGGTTIIRETYPHWHPYWYYCGSTTASLTDNTTEAGTVYLCTTNP